MRFNEVKFDQRIQARLPPMGEITCFNCGGLHSLYCEFPTYFVRCYRCLVISFDGSGHSPPCAPMNTISGTRKDIVAKTPLDIFKMRLHTNQGSVHYLNMWTGQFKEMTDGLNLLSIATDGLFSFKKSESHGTFSYVATSFNRFSFVIAVLDAKGFWRLRYRCVLSTVHGLLVFKLRSTLQMLNGSFVIPPEHQLNSTIILGIKPQSNEFKLQFKIFANKDGNIGKQTFNGYYSFITWTAAKTGGRDKLFIDDKIDGETGKERCLFNRLIQQESCSSPVVSFHNQRFDRT